MKIEIKVDKISDWKASRELNKDVDVKPSIVNAEDIWRIKRFKKSDDTRILYFCPTEPYDNGKYTDDNGNYKHNDCFRIFVSYKEGEQGKKKATEEIERLTKEIVEEVKRIANGERPSPDPNFKPPQKFYDPT